MDGLCTLMSFLASKLRPFQALKSCCSHRCPASAIYSIRTKVFANVVSRRAPELGAGEALLFRHGTALGAVRPLLPQNKTIKILHEAGELIV